MKIPTNQELSAISSREAVASTASSELSRFFPGFFELLLPVVLTAVPQIISAFRDEPGASRAVNPEAASERFVPELLSVLLPVLSAVMPVLIEQISAASRDTAAQPESEQRYEQQLPLLITAIIPALLKALREALAAGDVLNAGNGGVVAPDAVRMVRSQTANRFLGALLQIIPTAIATVLPQLFAVIEGRDGTSRGERAITWPDMRGVQLSDGDKVRAKFTPLDDPGAMTFAVELTGAVAWWKGIQLRNASGEVLHEAGPGEQILLSGDEADDFFEAGGALVLGKAKEFGHHRWMYTMGAQEVAKHRGQGIGLRWLKD